MTKLQQVLIVNRTISSVGVEANTVIVLVIVLGLEQAFDTRGVQTLSC